MSVKTYYNDSGISTKDKSPVNFYLNGGRDQANVIVTGVIFTPKVFGPRASITSDNLTFPLPTGQAGAAGNTNPNTGCQSYYGSNGGLGIACFVNTNNPASLRVQSNYTRTTGHTRFNIDNRLWRAKNIILTKNACIRIPYIDITITNAAAQTINLTNQTIQSLASKSYAKNAVAFRVRRTIARASGQDVIQIPNGTSAEVGTIYIICNLCASNLQISVTGGGVNFDDPRSTTLSSLTTLTIPGCSEIILMYRDTTNLCILQSLP
jgi:hypothetical protein